MSSHTSLAKTCHRSKLYLEYVYLFKVGCSHRRILHFGQCYLSIFIGICKRDKRRVPVFTFENFLNLWDHFYGKRGRYTLELNASYGIVGRRINEIRSIQMKDFGFTYSSLTLAFYRTFLENCDACFM